MSNETRNNKRIANADIKFQKEQLQAAQAAEQLSKAIAVVEQYRDELTTAQYAEVMGRFEEQKQEISDYLLKARNNYASKLIALGNPVIELEPEDLP